MHQIKYWLFAFLILLTYPHIVIADSDSEPDAPLSTVEEKVKDLLHMDGFFDLYWDQKTGQILLQIDHMSDEFIYQ